MGVQFKYGWLLLMAGLVWNYIEPQNIDPNGLVSANIAKANQGMSRGMEGASSYLQQIQSQLNKDADLVKSNELLNRLEEASRLSANNTVELGQRHSLIQGALSDMDAKKLALLASALTPCQALTKEGIDCLTMLYFLKGKIEGLKYALQ